MNWNQMKMMDSNKMNIRMINVLLLTFGVISCTSDYGQEKSMPSQTDLTTDSVNSDKRILAKERNDSLTKELDSDTVEEYSSESSESFYETTSYIETQDTIFLDFNTLVLFYSPNQEQFDTLIGEMRGQKGVDFNNKLAFFHVIAERKACYHLDSETCGYILHFDDAKHLSFRVDTSLYSIDGGSLEDYYGYVIYKQGCAPKHVSMPALPMGAEKLIAEDIIEYFNSCK